MQQAVPVPATRRAAVAAALVRGFHAYATWLVGISWKRFFVLSILLLIVTAILSELPPFNWTISQTTTEEPAKVIVIERGSGEKRGPAVKPEGAKSKPGDDVNVDISIGRDGVRIKQGRARPAEAAASAAPAASASAPTIDIRIPPGPVSEAVQQAIAEARREIAAAIEEAEAEAETEASGETGAQQAKPPDAPTAPPTVPKRTRVHKVRLGDFLPNLAMLWIVASIMIKITYKGRIQAEVKAARATEAAEAESLKRQVAEARMAALQAQVEPHFLFNTLASIDHLIETDPKRASLMQKNLITYLRATLHKMREGATTLGREVDLITAYLEILKVRMEERLSVSIDVSPGLRSAAFPPMMLQSLVENAVRHGLEPSSEPGSLRVGAEIHDGMLRVNVADTGVGFDSSNRKTSGTGLGLTNIRERLAMMYGERAALDIAANEPRGTIVTLTIPYTAMAQPANSAGATMSA